MATKQRFEPDEAWIVFRLNSAPIGTRRDGEFNCGAVMDAATLLIHSMEMVPAESAGPTCAQASTLLAKACGASGRFPAKLMVSADDPADEVAVEARRRGIEVARTPARSLSRFTREAREAFAARFGGTPSKLSVLPRVSTPVGSPYGFWGTGAPLQVIYGVRMRFGGSSSQFWGEQDLW